MRPRRGSFVGGGGSGIGLCGLRPGLCGIGGAWLVVIIKLVLCVL